MPSEKTRSDKKIKEKMIEVIKKLGPVPGDEDISQRIVRGHDTVVSRKRLRRLMQEMTWSRRCRAKMHIKDRQRTIIHVAR